MRFDGNEALPMNLEIKILDKNEVERFIDLIRIFEDVFEMESFVIPRSEHLWELLKQPGFTAAVALGDGQVVGGLTAYTLQQYYSEKPLAFIYDIAVDTKYQGRGVGTKLMEHFRNYCIEMKYDEAFLFVDENDKETVEFYRRSFSTEHEKVLHIYKSFQ